MYKGDLPSPEFFINKIGTWKVYWQEHSTNYGNASLSQEYTYSHKWPNINDILTTLATLPVTT
uniref:Uncharacterized protein n=1 Tax=Amphimedon queenslandica TaxID=400682 RepID=A0A1X7V6D5_AMPQE